MRFCIWRRDLARHILGPMKAEPLPIASPAPGIATGIGAFDGATVARRGFPDPMYFPDRARSADVAVDVVRRDLGMEVLCRAQLLGLVGRPDAALDRLDEALLLAHSAGDATLAVMVQLARSCILQSLGRESDAQVLRREILERGHRRGLLDAGSVNVGTPRLDDIDLSGTRPAVSARRLHAVPSGPDGREETEPPIRVRTLGAFCVLVRGQPFACGRKTPHKPLALLQALVALGGNNVAATVLVDALWPDADGGCGRRALDVALLRLRRLLGREDVVLVSGGRLTLNHDLCWVDAWAFDRAVDAIENLASRPSPERLHGLADSLLSLYRGRFLSAEEDKPWMMPARDRLAARFARALASCARVLVSAGEPAEAEGLYRRGLELDNLSEALYRGLMECCAAQGHRSEAINAYRRCRELLSIVLNTRPSDETEALYRRLSAG